ncbi:putative methyltransferase C9orf114 isoform X1 [Vigna umbellata]|uniref:putative methyltransferase C9orf114 isoform X1 n=1 Tax=Vigna umbellata TaxID=87088 RepID=UPI001F5E3FC2|nr:putative methyltransferase C9orf114 isoform X1 [Vigna umbellata]
MAKKNKKQTTDTEVEAERNGNNDDNDVSRNKKKLKKNKKKKKIPTVSMAVPASIIDNVPTLELATRLAGQIARAATIFRINEVVVFDNKRNLSVLDNLDDESSAAFLMRILQYLETPQYLRKALFRMHNSLRFVGLLPPLDAPHHLRKHEWGPYREGVTVKERDSNSGATLVDVGLVKNVIVDEIFEPGRRVTVAMGTNRNLDSDLPRQVVSSSKPSEEGVYWGYQVRYAHNISSVFKDCTYKQGGYDFIIGTSEHGQIIKSSNLEIPSFRHLLIAFGGLAGLEESVEEDDNLKGKKAQDIFNLYLNTCPHQGSRTIRTEEAIFISLQYFQEPISRVLEG